MRIRLVVHERVGNDIKCLRAALERLEGGRDILRSPDFECGDIEAKRAGRCLNLAHLQHGVGIADIGHDRQPAETGDNLAQEFEPLASKIGLLDRQAGDVAARSRQARDQAGADRVSATAKTIGMTDVACFAARTAAVPDVTMTSTLSRTNSAAISAKRSLRPSAQRYSIATVRPSIQPSSRSRCTKAATHWLLAEGVPAPKNPMVGSFPGCCARAASGHAAAAPPSSVMNSRRLMLLPSGRGAHPTTF